MTQPFSLNFDEFSLAKGGLYEPTQPYFDRSWPLGDFEEIKQIR